MAEMDIYLVDLATADIIRFPMLPERINCGAATRFASYDIMNVGEIKTPLGEELSKFSWDGILPGESRKEEKYIRMWSNPKGIQEKLSHFRNAGSRLHLFIPGTPIDHKVYLESYSVEYSGGMGDYNYSVNFVQLKDLKMSTQPPPSPLLSGKAGSKNGKGIEKAQENRPPKQQESFYVVEGGDSLWKISQRILGNGGRYEEIAKLNHINSGDILKRGQKLQMPNR